MNKFILAVMLMLFSTAAFAVGSATLSWDYLATDVTAFNVTNFNLERKPGTCAAAGAFAEVATPAATVRTHVDGNLTSGNVYCWRIAASGTGGKSVYSNTVEKLVPFGVPPAPGNVNVIITISITP